MIERALIEFMSLVECGNIEIYNEFSLQHELGLFLREKLKGYKVQFERNTKFFEILDTIKHEIDIVAYNGERKYAIELKFPVNGQYPEQMYSFIKDISFMEQLKNAGFDNTYCLTVVNDSKFYTGKKTDGVYSFFRRNVPVHGVIAKPTGQKDETVHLNGVYQIKWNTGNRLYSYYIVSI